MIEHDNHIGQPDHLDKAGLTDNTIVIYTTDNG
jgi:arylsulfatase